MNAKLKKTYSLISNTVYMFRSLWQVSQISAICCGAGIFIRVVLPFAGIMMPKLVIDAIEARVSPFYFILIVGGIAFIMVILNFLNGYCDAKINKLSGMILSFEYSCVEKEKVMDMDYELYENPDVISINDKAHQAIQNNYTPAMNLPRTFVEFTVNILGLVLYGSIIAMIHPLIILFLMLTTAINWFFLRAARRYEEHTRDERSKLDRKYRYVSRCMKDPEMAKDVRLYSMYKWFLDMVRLLTKKIKLMEGKVQNRNMISQLVNGFLILIRDSAVYAYLIWLLLKGDIAIGDFVLVFAAVGSFAGLITGIIFKTSEFFRASSEVSDIRVFFDLPDKTNRSKGVPLPTKSQMPLSITLESVSYTYPKAEKPTLRDINVSIKPGERIAIVGMNGAGKTTLVKLLCGLYRPNLGIIRINGVDINKYNRDEYFTLFSVVFQDIYLLTDSIAGNVSQQMVENTDLQRVEKSLKLAGLYDKVKTLQNGVNTQLVKSVNERATELSGGEKQKLALARALYKDAPVIILDEPTAALDPIAENEIYQKYAELTEGRTSVYISHRLASTRFCDRILFLDNQTIEEEGTHDELMRLGGKYANMFNIQSSYYSKEEAHCVK